MTNKDRDELKQLAENPHSMGYACTVSAKHVLDLIAENQRMRELLLRGLMEMGTGRITNEIKSFLADPA